MHNKSVIMMYGLRGIRCWESWQQADGTFISSPKISENVKFVWKELERSDFLNATMPEL